MTIMPRYLQRHQQMSDSSSAYSTISSSSPSPTSLPSFQHRHSIVSNTGRGSILEPSRAPSISRTRSCDLIVLGTAITPIPQLPPAPLNRGKFTTLMTLGNKPTTKPLPFTFSNSTRCNDGSCRRFTSKSDRYLKSYQTSVDDILQKHSRISENLDSLAKRVRKVFNPKAVPCQNVKTEQIDIATLMANAETINRNLEISAAILSELMETKASLIGMRRRQNETDRIIEKQKSLEQKLASLEISRKQSDCISASTISNSNSGNQPELLSSPQWTISTDISLD